MIVKGNGSVVRQWFNLFEPNQRLLCFEVDVFDLALESFKHRNATCSDLRQNAEFNVVKILKNRKLEVSYHFSILKFEGVPVLVIKFALKLTKKSPFRAGILIWAVNSKLSDWRAELLCIDQLKLLYYRVFRERDDDFTCLVTRKNWVWVLVRKNRVRAVNVLGGHLNMSSSVAGKVLYALEG